MAGRLRSGRFKRQEEVNPLEGAINIVDAMLVFACGLMLALVIRWNVDLTRGTDYVNVHLGQEVTKETDMRGDLIETRGEGQLYERMGTVYKDPATGQMFMLAN